MGGVKWNSRQYLRYLSRLGRQSHEADLTSTKHLAMSSLLLDAIEKSVTSLIPAFIAINFASHI